MNFHHINHLPVEILSYIFTLATHGTLSPTNDFKQRYQVPFSPDSVAMPTVLASVHRHWRNVALSTSSLWTSLVMSLEQVVRIKIDHHDRAFLDVQRLAAHIARSRNSPVDILIDTRDPEWNFEDNEEEWEECSIDKEPSVPYAVFIPQILDFLFPQMFRWRSLTILSDTWAPLHAALQRLSVPTLINASGAPKLETLMLMQCNDFLGHCRTFTPRAQRMLDGIPFAALIPTPLQNHTKSRPLPKLRNVTLVGVHLNWSDFSHYTLGAALNHPLSPLSEGIHSLELSQHCNEVRPTWREFSQILKACPLLKRLVIRVSGPKRVEGDQHDGRPVSLPCLEELHLGYTSIAEATLLLSHISAPNLIALSIQDTNHIVIPDYEDSSPLLTYCATGSPDLRLISVFSEPGPNHDDERVSATATSISTTTAKTTMKPPFPCLERLSLDNVSACMTPFTLFMAAVPKLRHLCLRRTPNALIALLPTQRMLFGGASTVTLMPGSGVGVGVGSGAGSVPGPTTKPKSSGTPTCRMPCPVLESIEIVRADKQARHALDFVLREREKRGAPRLRSVDVDDDLGYGYGECSGDVADDADDDDLSVDSSVDADVDGGGGVERFWIREESMARMGTGTGAGVGVGYGEEDVFAFGFGSGVFNDSHPDFDEAYYFSS